MILNEQKGNLFVMDLKTHTLIKQINNKLEITRNKMRKIDSELEELEDNINPDIDTYSDFKDKQHMIKILRQQLLDESKYKDGIESCREIVMDYLIKESEMIQNENTQV
jgi:vacuolar-type H+-ATPase subunit I/STV1